MESLPLELSALIIGAATYLITFVSQKTRISQTWLAMGLSLVGGMAYYVATNYYAFEWGELIRFAGGAYASSQIIYNIIRKVFLEPKTS